jgi:hypothetical protein
MFGSLRNFPQVTWTYGVHNIENPVEEMALRDRGAHIFHRKPCCSAVAKNGVSSIAARIRFARRAGNDRRRGHEQREQAKPTGKLPHSY